MDKKTSNTEAVSDSEVKLEVNSDAKLELNADNKSKAKAKKSEPKTEPVKEVKTTPQKQTKVKTKAEESQEVTLDTNPDMELAVAGDAQPEPIVRKKKRRHFSEITAENDIKFRGPLTYRHLRIMAWVALAIAQIGVMLTVYKRFDAGAAATIDSINTVTGLLGTLATPLFLFANFAIILSGRESFKKSLIRFGALAGAFLLAFIIVYAHYILGILTALCGGDRATARELFLSVVQLGHGYLAFNIFLDLLLCTLFLFFLNYKPKKIFVGKKLIIFRLFALLPLIYEAVSVTLKILSSMGTIALLPWFYPFLTTKPPLAFLMFIALGLHLKRREHSYIKRGKTAEEHKEFINTNANSLHFSIHTSVVIVITVILDAVLFVLIAAICVSTVPGIEDPAVMGAAIESALSMVYHWGFGQSIPLLLLIPIVMFFSYTRTCKHPKFDIFVPLAGVALIVLLYIEGAFQLICLLPGQIGG